MSRVVTDRDLLAAAAKAAGLEFNGQWFDAQTGLLVWEPPHNFESRDWNPLIDDGDALRLAVKMRLMPEIAEWSDGPWAFVPAEPGCAEQLGDDPYAATRRAIVRAAAEIGKESRPLPIADEIRDDWT